MHPFSTPTRLPRWTPALAALLLAQILPVLPPRRANHARRGPRFSVVAPCRRGGAPNAAAALGTPGRLARLGATPDFHHGLLDRSIRAECVPRITVEILIREFSGRFRNSALETQEQARFKPPARIRVEHQMRAEFGERLAITV